MKDKAHDCCCECPDCVALYGPPPTDSEIEAAIRAADEMTPEQKEKCDKALKKNLFIRWLRQSEELTKLRAENERLRGGLESIYCASGQENGTPETVIAGIRHMRLKIDELICNLHDQEAEQTEDQNAT